VHETLDILSFLKRYAEGEPVFSIAKWQATNGVRKRTTYPMGSLWSGESFDKRECGFIQHQILVKKIGQNNFMTVICNSSNTCWTRYQERWGTLQLPSNLRSAEKALILFNRDRIQYTELRDFPYTISWYLTVNTFTGNYFCNHLIYSICSM
jgi:hypothetical protein